MTEATTNRMSREQSSLVSREIGLQIRARRNELGLTQAGLAQQIGVSQQQVNKYESGVGRIPAEQLMKLCRTLRIELSSLFRPFDKVGVEAGFAEAEQTPFIVEAFADKDVVTLVRTFQGIKDKRVRRKILDLVATIADEPAADEAPSPNGKRG